MQEKKLRPFLKKPRPFLNYPRLFSKKVLVFFMSNYDIPSAGDGYINTREKVT
jgi:hypothetical protein